jgi:UDP-N-acetyl-D-mannosaminuronic acid transferase (WecB/TagA/CpsF family)
MSWLYRLVNEPWIYGPRWWRAHRLSKARARQLDAEHVAWAQALAKGAKR